MNNILKSIAFYQKTEEKGEKKAKVIPDNAISMPGNAKIIQGKAFSIQGKVISIVGNDKII